MIGSWDNSKTILSLNPNAERSFRLTDENTGFANLYNGESASSKITANLVNCATGYGFIAKTKSSDAYYNLDGVNDYIKTTATNSLSNLPAFSLHFTIKILQVKAEMFFTYAPASDKRIICYYNSTYNRLYFFNENTTGAIYCDASTFFKIGTTLAITCVFDGTLTASNRGAIYINGQKQTSTVVYSFPTATATVAASPLFIMSYSPGTYSVFGHVYNFIIYQKALSAEEINRLIDMPANNLLAVNNSDGTIDLIDNKIGLFNPYGNNLALLPSVEPRTDIVNTGFANLYNGESASSKITASLTNTVNSKPYGFIPKGWVCKFEDNATNALVYNNNLFFSGVHYFKIDFILELDDITGSTCLFSTPTDTNNEIQLYSSDGPATTFGFLIRLNSTLYSMHFNTTNLLINHKKHYVTFIFDGNNGDPESRASLTIDSANAPKFGGESLPTLTPNTAAIQNFWLGRLQGSGNTFNGIIHQANGVNENNQKFTIADGTGVNFSTGYGKQLWDAHYAMTHETYGQYLTLNNFTQQTITAYTYLIKFSSTTLPNNINLVGSSNGLLGANVWYDHSETAWFVRVYDTAGVELKIKFTQNFTRYEEIFLAVVMDLSLPVADKIKVFNSVEKLTTTVVTSNDITDTYLKCDYIGLSSAPVVNHFNGRFFNFTINKYAMSELQIFDYYQSSKDAWQQDLKGELNNPDDGLMNLSAEYTYLDAQTTMLELTGGSSVAHSFATYKAGKWKRESGVTESFETFFRFNLENFIRKILIDAKILVYVNDKNNSRAITSNIFEQDKITNIIDSPQYSDFALAEWANSVAAQDVEDVDIYEYFKAPALITLIESWLSKGTDYNNGLILDADFENINEYIAPVIIRLGLKVGESDVTNQLHYIGRGIRIGVGVGLC